MEAVNRTTLAYTIHKVRPYKRAATHMKYCLEFAERQIKTKQMWKTILALPWNDMFGEKTRLLIDMRTSKCGDGGIILSYVCFSNYCRFVKWIPVKSILIPGCNTSECKNIKR